MLGFKFLIVLKVWIELICYRLRIEEILSRVTITIVVERRNCQPGNQNVLVSPQNLSIVCLEKSFNCSESCVYFNSWIGCAGSSLLRGLSSGYHGQGLLLVQGTGSHCSGLSRRGAWAVECSGSRSCGSSAPRHRLSSCGARAELPCGMWDLPGPGIRPVSPALAGLFFSPEPTGKSWTLLFLKRIEHFSCCNNSTYSL